MNFYNLLIALHALSGIVSFVFGCFVIGFRQWAGDWRFRTYAGALLSLVALIIVVVVIDWPQLSGGSRVTFSILVALGFYMLWRAYRAGRELHLQPDGWRPRYIDHVGFTLISLFDGFAIVAALDLNAPPFVTGLIAILGIVVGIAGVNRIKARYSDSRHGTR